jgi:hypothetical protein
MKAFPEIQRNFMNLIECSPTSVADALKVEAASLRLTIDTVEQARQQLNIIECSMRILLELLEEADAKQLVSSHLYCLLMPMHSRLLDTIIKIDTAL